MQAKGLREYLGVGLRLQRHIQLAGPPAQSQRAASKHWMHAWINTFLFRNTTFVTTQVPCALVMELASGEEQSKYSTYMVRSFVEDNSSMCWCTGKVRTRVLWQHRVKGVMPCNETEGFGGASSCSSRSDRWNECCDWAVSVQVVDVLGMCVVEDRGGGWRG